MVIKASYRMVIRSAMKNLPNLLKETFPVELCCGYESVFSQQNMLAFESSIEAIENMSVKYILIKC